MILRLTIATAALLIYSNTQAKNKVANVTQGLCLIENKGQIKDQNARNRDDIQFSMQGHGINVFIGNGQLHYQFIKTEANNPRLEHMKPADLLTLPEDPQQSYFSTTTRSYRLDVTLLGADIAAKVITGKQQRYYEHYYLPGSTVNGTIAHTYNKITYQNVYPHIDWVIFVKDGKMEHEFVVKEGGDASLIKLKYSGQTSLILNKDGSISAVTPMGVVTEQAPVCICAEGCIAPSSYHLSGDLLSYDVNVAGKMTIDPIIEWGTYYGPDSSTSPMYSVVCDKYTNIYGCGLTYSAEVNSIATTGSHQVLFGGEADAYVVKFDSSGQRLWATYYGGEAGDWGNSIACDSSGNVYLAGTTHSSSNIATAGCQQPTFAGGLWDGFLAKFDTGGVRQWGTYIGGSGANIPSSVGCDKVGRVFISGDSNDPNNISTPGSYQPVKSGGYDGFLVLYNTTTGLREWGTYYGGAANEFGNFACTDGYNFYVAGFTSSTSTIATPFCYQATVAGGNDAFLMKLFDDGSKAWGTYFGGEMSDGLGAITCDKQQAIYMLGSTGSITGIATSDAAQPAKGGGVNDAFVAKFEPELGHVMWATYYGGAGEENVDLSKIITDDSLNVYITGYTSSNAGISSGPAWQAAYGGGDYDGFWAKYKYDGSLTWSTYYGGTGIDEGRATAYDGSAVYLCGKTNSTTNIATPDGFIPAGGGDPYLYQGYLVKYGEPDTSTVIPVDTTTAVHTIVGSERIHLYPVPNKGTFSVKGVLGTSGGTVHITITDITGKLVFGTDAQLTDGMLDKQINMGTAGATGAYILKITSQHEVYVLRFSRL